MNQITTHIATTLAEAHAKILGGIEHIREGCRLYVAVLDTDPDEARAFMRSRGVTDEFLDLMESVGRGRIHPRLMFMPGAGPERLQRAPLAEQERLLNTGVEVVRLVNNEPRVTVKPVAALTKAEAAQALDSTGNTPKEVQIERLKREMITTVFKMPPYSLDGDTLLARENCKIPFADLERLYHAAAEAHQKKRANLERDMKKAQIR